MTREFCELNVRVLSVTPIGKYEGEAILAQVDPKFVVALLIEDTKQLYEASHTKVSFFTHRVAFFAIRSVVKVFMENQVVGNNYRVRIETDIIEGKKWFSIARI